MDDRDSSLTAERVRELFTYDPNTGEFRWREQTWRRKSGVAGSPHADGYLQVKITIGPRRKRGYLLHRLAWLYVYGEWPAQFIDHINGDRKDNRIANLRAATAAQNSANSRAHRRNKCGLKGVYFHKRDQQWRAQIRVGPRNHYLGAFDSAEAAHAAYRTAAVSFRGEFARYE